MSLALVAKLAAMGMALLRVAGVGHEHDCWFERSLDGIPIVLPERHDYGCGAWEARAPTLEIRRGGDVTVYRRGLATARVSLGQIGAELDGTATTVELDDRMAWGDAVATIDDLHGRFPAQRFVVRQRRRPVPDLGARPSPP